MHLAAAQLLTQCTGFNTDRTSLRLRVKTRRPKAKKATRAQKTDVASLPAADIDIPEGNWRLLKRGITAPQGFTAAGISAGLRSKGTCPDLSLVCCERPAVAAGVFTKNLLSAAPVAYDRKILDTRSHIRAVVINAGQANAATGEQGYQDAERSALAVADRLSVDPSEVLVMSTGVIGQRVKMDRLLAYIPSLAYSMNADAATDIDVAVAMTTTDLVYKTAAIELEIDGRLVTIGGVCKGSGMIHPNMATLLGLITCDAPVEPSLWKQMLRQAVDSSFNRISVDGDTSTNDTILALSSGNIEMPTITDSNSKAGEHLQEALTSMSQVKSEISPIFVPTVCTVQGLAKSVAWDGEGATCLIETTVVGAESDADAVAVAKSIITSNLTKAAVFGNDPNWGRIAAAAGYAGIPFAVEELDITLGTIPLMRKGTPLNFDPAQASSYLKERCSNRGTVTIDVRIGDGSGRGTAWGCDLSYDYVRINAEYTT